MILLLGYLIQPHSHPTSAGEEKTQEEIDIPTEKTKLRELRKEMSRSNGSSLSLLQSNQVSYTAVTPL